MNYLSITQKIPLAMRVTLILLCLIAFQLQAEDVYSQKTKISLDMKNASVEKVLQTIEEESDYYFLYNNKLVNVDRKVSVRVKNAAISDILDKLFTSQDVEYQVEGKQIILSPKEKAKEIVSLVEGVQQQQKTITGKVTDSNGEPIIGANIIEVGTTNGTVTDIDGNFTLNVSDDAVLRISFIGYIEQNVNTAGKNTLQVVLREDTKTLEELVVVGYGVQKKVNLTGAVSSITFDDELNNRPITNASQALSGKIPGVWVSQNSGKPGSDEAQLRVRGWGTLNNTEPLVIVDGVEGNFGQVNPNDIESISVLKDAASAAIYGSKAANGVILITTKMGNYDETPIISLNSYAGVQMIGRKFNLINNSAESMKMTNIALQNAGSSSLFPDYLISEFESGNDPYKYPNTNWYDYVYREAFIQEHNLSIRGGTRKSNSYFSANYLSQEGIMRNTDSERFRIRANLEYNLRSWLKVGGRLNYVRGVSNEPYNISRVHDMLQGATPYIAPYTRDGRFGSVQAIDKDGILLYDNRNPLIDASNGANKTTNSNTNINVFAEIDLAKNLNLKTMWTTIDTQSLTDRYNEQLFGYTDTGMETMTKNYNQRGLEMIRNQASNITNNFQTTLNFNQKFGNAHVLSGVVGIQTEDYTGKNVHARRTNPPKPGLTQVSAGVDGIEGEGNMWRLRMVSYFGRINYSLKDRYLFEMNLRTDGSSRFKRGNRWGTFPGFSAGWRVSEEPFIKDLDIFSNLKLRASWGQLGNQRIDDYWPYLSIINQNDNLSYSYNGVFSPGAAVTSLVDDNITWETTTSSDFGIDVGFLNNKLTLEADYFTKKTTGIIVQLPIPRILGGLNPPYQNRGEMTNKGFEVSLKFDNRNRDRNILGMDVGANFTYVDNKVSKFEYSPDQLYLIREGYSYQSLYGYRVVGIYQTDDEAKEHMHANSYKPKAGDLKFEDVNEDGALGYQDKQGIGNTIPKVTYGLNFGVNYKGFDLNLLFQGIGGVNAFNRNGFTQLLYEKLTITEAWRNSWSKNNPNAKMPRLEFNSAWNNSESSFWVNKMDFLKLKNIQLGYGLSEKLTSRLKLEKLYIYANAQNLFTIMWHKGYEGYDPERNTFSDGGAVYPAPRILTFGINIDF